MLKEEIEKKNLIIQKHSEKKITIKRMRIKIETKNKFYFLLKVKLKIKINLTKGLKKKIKQSKE
jgi:hypothetical protein